MKLLKRSGRERNNRCFANHRQTKERIIDSIRRLERDKGIELSNINLNSKNAVIAKKWRLPKSIIKTNA